MRAVLLAAFAAVALAAAAPAAAEAAVPAHARVNVAPTLGAAAPLVARGGFGRGFGSRSYGRPRSRVYPHSTFPRRSPFSGRSPFSRRGRGFFHGLFWGFLLGHWFSSGGFPVFLLVVVGLVAFSATRRRRRRMRYGW